MYFYDIIINHLTNMSTIQIELLDFKLHKPTPRFPFKPMVFHPHDTRPYQPYLKALREKGVPLPEVVVEKVLPPPLE